MRIEELFEGDEDDILGLTPGGVRSFNRRQVDQLRRGPLPEVDDIEIAVPLAQLIHDDLEKFGTGGGEELDDQDMRAAIASLHAVLTRLSVSAQIPFRDFVGFKSWWVRNDAYGSWQARRDLLFGLFEPIHEQLALIEQKAIGSTLADPVTSHPRTGWAALDSEISELRRHFQNAKSPQDYRAVGLDCVAIAEALSRQVYDPAKHLRAGEEEPPVANTKQRLDRYVDDRVPGKSNATLRKLAKASIEYAQHVKHSATPTRQEAGIAADSVIQLANILRRLAEDE